MKNNRAPLSIRLTEDIKDRLQKVAAKKRISVSDLVRELIDQGLSADAYREDEAKVLANMQVALREELAPSIERLAKIGSKNAIASSVNLLLTSMLLERWCKPESKPRLERFMEEARKLGTRFVRDGKGSVESFLRSSMEQLAEVWEDE